MIVKNKITLNNVTIAKFDNVPIYLDIIFTVYTYTIILFILREVIL